MLDTIRQIATIPAGSPPVAWAQAITDLQAICAAAYEAEARTIGGAQPPGSGPRNPGILSLTDLRHVIGTSLATVRRMVRHARRIEQEDASAER